MSEQIYFNLVKNTSNDNRNITVLHHAVSRVLKPYSGLYDISIGLCLPRRKSQESESDKENIVNARIGPVVFDH